MSGPVTLSGTKPPPSVQYYLASAICLYTHSRQADPTIALQHTAGADGSLGPGKPIDPVALARTIYRLKQGEMVEKLTLTGEHVLAENRDAVLWWRPASVTPLYFKTTDPVPELTALNGVPIPQPPLVFKATKKSGSLSVWALVEDRRPTADTPLYCAPYMNQFEGGGVCLGNARSRELSDLKKAGPADWENVFFNSNFSHTPPRLNYVCLKKKASELEAYAAFLTWLRDHGTHAPWSRLLRSGQCTLASVL